MRTKNPRFMSIYNGSWRGMTRWGWGATLFRLAFTGSKTKNLPRNSEIMDANITSDDGVHHIHLILKPFVPSTKRGSWGRILHNSNHRVFIMCDRCDHMVPAGRIHQHTC